MKQDGWKSRKLWLAVATGAMIFYGFKLSGAPKELYGQYCMALLTSAGLFKASSVYEKIKTTPLEDKNAAPTPHAP